MKITSLKFPSMFELWKFRLKVHLLHVLIFSGAILTCELSDDDINLAVDSYKAVIVEMPCANEGEE